MKKPFFSRNDPNAVLVNAENNIPANKLSAMFRYARQHATVSGTIITAAKEGTASQVIDQNNNNITPESENIFSSHDILNYQGEHYIILKPHVYWANQDDDEKPNILKDRGSREVLLLKNERGEVFIAKVITVYPGIKDRILQSAANEIQLAHQFGMAPHAQYVTKETTDGNTQIFLLQFWEGVNLQEVFKADILSFEEKTNIAAQILKIIRNIHAHGYLLRDIQLQNFVINKNNATGFYDVSFVDFGKIVKFDLETGKEFDETNTDPDSKHTIWIDMQRVFFEIGGLFPQPDTFDSYCFNMAQDASEAVMKEKRISDIQIIIDKVIADIAKALQTTISTVKEAVHEFAGNYKSDISKRCCSLFFNKKHGKIGQKRATTLENTTESAQTVKDVQGAFKQCFSHGRVSKIRTNDHSLLRYAAANQVIVKTFQLKALTENTAMTETDQKNLKQLGGGRYGFWCNDEEEKHTEDQKQSLQKISGAIQNAFCHPIRHK